MDAVAAQLDGEVGPVVHDEGDVAFLRDGPQHVGGAPDGVVVHVLQAKLKAGDIASLQRIRQRARERRRIERRRRDQVQAAAGGNFRVPAAQALPW
jgi:hypothetical protein